MPSTQYRKYFRRGHSYKILQLELSAFCYVVFFSISVYAVLELYKEMEVSLT